MVHPLQVHEYFFQNTKVQITTEIAVFIITIFYFLLNCREYLITLYHISSLNHQVARPIEDKLEFSLMWVKGLAILLFKR